MDFSIIFQLKTKKFWWMDVILYFVISLLLATLFCYLVFSIKNSSQRQDIQNATIALQTVGTVQQKDEEKEVINYQKKINDFSNLLKNHGFASNVFAFMEKQTIPNVWYKQFSLDAKNNEIQISGEADDMDALSRQIAVFESTQNQKYIKNIGTLNSSLGTSSRIEFSTNLLLNPNIFSYLSVLPSISQTTTPSNLPLISQTVTPASQLTTNNPPATNIPAESVLPSSGVKSGEKNITAFHFLLKPEVVGILDQTNYIVTLNVPYDTNVKNLISSIVVSPGATVSPASKVSQDFTQPVAYRVTAEDGTVQSYQVKVVVAVASPINEEKSQPGSALLMIIMFVGIAIAVISAIILLVWKKILSRKVKKQ